MIGIDKQFLTFVALVIHLYHEVMNRDTFLAG